MDSAASSSLSNTTLLAPRVSPVNTAYKAMLGLEEYLHKSGLEESLLHLVKLRTSQINGCAYCLDMHWKDLRAIGACTKNHAVTHLFEGRANTLTKQGLLINDDDPYRFHRIPHSSAAYLAKCVPIDAMWN